MGAVLGALMLPSAIALLVWNEVESAGMGLALVEGAGAVQEAPPDRVDPALEGKLVHAAGPLRLPAFLADPDLPAIQAPGAAVLWRSVLTYAWEERSSRGGSVSYAQVWSDKPIDSARFRQPGGPQNPPPRYLARVLVASDATLGPYRLAEPLLATLGNARPNNRLPAGTLYVGQDPGTPRIGDQKLTWESAQPTSASVLARQSGAGFEPFRAASGATIQLIEPGTLSARQMLGDAEHAATASAWFLRVIGAGLLSLSVFLLLRARTP